MLEQSNMQLVAMKRKSLEGISIPPGQFVQTESIISGSGAPSSVSYECSLCWATAGPMSNCHLSNKNEVSYCHWISFWERIQAIYLSALYMLNLYCQWISLFAIFPYIFAHKQKLGVTWSILAEMIQTVLCDTPSSLAYPSSCWHWYRNSTQEL